MVKKKNIQTKSANKPQDDLTRQDNPDYHIPVMLQEVIRELNIEEDGIYVDCTFGGGGHSKEILKQLSDKGRLFVFDQDAEARRNLPDDHRILFIQHNFRHLQRFLRLHKIIQANGILADLGVSSHQFDDVERGFSLRFDADLDMRMDKRQPLTAFDVVSRHSEQQLHKIFERYGEVTNAKTLAKTIVQKRQTESLKTINGFKQAIRDVVKGNPNRYFAQVFQALRIEVNDELGALKEMLEQAPGLLKQGGRIAIITFHSLEDRIVKNFFKNGSFGEEMHQDPFGVNTVAKTLQVITKKPIVPSAAEMARNPRSRSAKLRVAEKI
ncbi:MAG TPA: 16S rRNA (cytosine(1402)-N(4))-methyltransferase RsmH [Puia sp.]|nr:16S rRNA (cytosine(1402)-N(4))-methyltransferase RsmH [Puia sp.]